MRNVRIAAAAFAFICLLGAPLPRSAASAQDGWTFIVTDPSGNSIYYRALPRGSGNPAWMRIEIRSEYPSPLGEGDISISSSINSADLDCGRRRYRFLGGAGYSGRGLTGESYSFDTPAEAPWETPEPDSPIELSLNRACGF